MLHTENFIIAANLLVSADWNKMKQSYENKQTNVIEIWREKKLNVITVLLSLTTMSVDILQVNVD